MEKKTHPLTWIPSIYLMEGMPAGFIVLVNVIMYKKMDISNAEIAFYTSLLTIPWAIRPFWASLIEMFNTKRWWICTMQYMLAISFALIATSLKTPYFFILPFLFFFLAAFFSATHDMATDGFYILNLSFEQQALYIGFCGVCYNIGKLISTGLIVVIAGELMNFNHTVQNSWFTAILIGAGIAALFATYNLIMMPRHESLTKKKPVSFTEGVRDFFKIIVEFFKLEKVWMALAFIMLFELGESQILRIAPLFLLVGIDKGRLGLDTAFVGMVYGISATIAILLAGFIGGYLIYRKGLKFWMWPMYFAINIPHLLCILLSYTQTSNKLLIGICVFLEQFGYGFGFTAYLLYLRYVVRNSPYKTAHYAFLAGFIYLSLAIPGMFSGILQQLLGYNHFFILIIVMMLPAILVIKKLGIDPSFGKKTQ